MVPSVEYNMKWIVLLCLIVEFRHICAQDELQTETSEFTETTQQETAPNVTTINKKNENNPFTELSSPSNIYIAEVPIAKVQKCCQINEELYIDPTLQKSVCRETNDIFLVELFTFNQTHYWNYTNSNQRNVEIYVNDPCKEKKIYLDPFSDINDTYRLLNNGSLYIPEMYLMHGVDKYCLDILHDESNSFVTAFICEAALKPSVMHFFFGTGQIISFISLLILALYSMHRRDIDEDHKKCLAWFSSIRAIAFLNALINTFVGLYLHEYANIFMGYLQFYLTLCYYFWVNILCLDTWRCVEAGNDNTRKSQMTFFSLFAFLLPLLILVISFIDFGKPVIPRTYINLYAPSEMAWLVLIPIGISCVLNLICCSKMNLPKPKKLKSLDEFIKEFKNNKISKIRSLKNMYRRSCFLFCFLSIMWISDIIITALPVAEYRQAHFIIHDVTTCLQGLFISLIFVPKDWLDCKRRKEPSHESHELHPIKNDETTIIE